jgi:hypothetical protein
MKSKTITFEEVEYEIRSFGFFKANRILMGTLMPLFKSMSSTVSDMQTGEQDLSEMAVKIAESLTVESLEEVLKNMLSNIYVDEVKFDPDTIDDYELGIELTKEAVLLNYSSLGKLARKLMDMLPNEED